MQILSIRLHHKLWGDTPLSHSLTKVFAKWHSITVWQVRNMALILEKELSLFNDLMQKDFLQADIAVF